MRSKTQVFQNYCVSFVSTKFTEEPEELVICAFSQLGSAAKVWRTFCSRFIIVGRAASSLRDQDFTRAWNRFFEKPFQPPKVKRLLPNLSEDIVDTVTSYFERYNRNSIRQASTDLQI